MLLGVNDDTSSDYKKALLNLALLVWLSMRR